MTYLESLNQGLLELLETLPEVVIFGEDLLDPYGGAFKVTRGLQRQFPDRVLTTPISEGALAGMANGMALRSLRPILEIMFGDFLALCMDQILNHTAKFNGMYNGRVTVPVTIRTPMGGGRGYGPTHSQSIEKLFLGIPEIRIVAPSQFGDPGALLKQAVHDDCPVLFIEHKLLYPTELLRSANGTLEMATVSDGEGYPVALVRNYHGGRPDVTIVTYGGMSRFLPGVLERMREEEIRVLACVPAMLKPLPFEVLRDAAAESGRVVVAEEGSGAWGWGAELAARLHSALFGKLAVPVHRVAARNSVIPAARTLESYVLPAAKDLDAAILKVIE
jgi:pyruvate/2-oxoglutarate/acetoin dehydrogenase E1 component